MLRDYVDISYNKDKIKHHPQNSNKCVFWIITSLNISHSLYLKLLFHASYISKFYTEDLNDK